MTRVLEISPTRAVKRAEPSFVAEFIVAHASPLRVVTVRVSVAPPAMDSSSVAGIGVVMRLWYESKTYMEPLMPLATLTGKRDGFARKPSDPGCVAGSTSNSELFAEDSVASTAV